MSVKMIRLLICAILAPFMAYAQETRRVTDHAGYVVEVPLAPERVVSLSDWTTTVMAYELGVGLVASVGRSDGNGQYHIRSGRELHGLEFGPGLELASVHSALDLERIAALNPDLILGLRSDTIAYRDQLSALAPVLLFDTENGRDMVSNYADFAGWLGKTAEFDAMLAQYHARLTPGASGSYLVLRPNTTDGTIEIYRDFGAVTVVMDDLGYTPLPIVEEIPLNAQRSTFSAEMLGAMNADMLVMGHMEDRGQTADTSLEDLERVAPGASGFLGAFSSGRFMSLSRFHIAAPSFAALDYVLDYLDATPACAR